MKHQDLTLHAIARELGVPDERYSFLKNLYETNRHDPTLLLEEIKQLPRQEEKETIMAYVGAVVAGRAKDDLLYWPYTD